MCFISYFTVSLAKYREKRLLVVVVVLVVLRPRLTSKVMSGRSFNLITLFLGRLRPPKRLTSTSCPYFRQ